MKKKASDIKPFPTRRLRGWRECFGEQESNFLFSFFRLRENSLIGQEKKPFVTFPKKICENLRNLWIKNFPEFLFFLSSCSRFSFAPLRSLREVFILLLLLLLVSCVQAPPRLNPVELGVTTPDTWTEKSVAGDIADGWIDSFKDKTLVQLVEEALEHNHDLKIAAAQMDSALANARIAGADVYPQIDAGFSGGKSQTLTRARSGQDSFGGFARSRTTSLDLSLDISWELDVWGRLRSQKSATLADVQAAEADFRDARFSLAAQTAKTWFATTEAHLQLQLAEEIVKNHRQTVELTRNRFSSGLVSAADVYLARSNFASVEADLEQTRMVYKAAVRNMETLLGRYPAAELKTAKKLSRLPSSVPAGLPSELLERRPDVIAAERAVASARKSLSSAKAARLPRISLSAGGGTSSDALRDLIDLKHDVWNFALNLLQPVIDGGKLAADQDLAGANVRQAVAQYGKTALTAFNEVETALSSEQLLANREKSLRTAVEEASSAYERTRNQYSNGLIDFLKVLDAQQRMFNARKGLLSVQKERLENRVNLHLALGGGFEGQLSQKVARNGFLFSVESLAPRGRNRSSLGRSPRKEDKEIFLALKERGRKKINKTNNPFFCYALSGLNLFCAKYPGLRPGLDLPRPVGAEKHASTSLMNEKRWALNEYSSQAGSVTPFWGLGKDFLSKHNQNKLKESS